MRAYQPLTFCLETIRHSSSNCNLSLSLGSVGATKRFLAVLSPIPGHSYIAAVLLFFLQSFSETGSNNDDECKVQVKVIY
jgi:hypothetical protein